MDKYNYLIEISRELPLINPALKVTDNLINGCQSKVWLNAEFSEGKINLTADSDAIITKGIIALLIRVFSGRTPKEILDTELFFIDEIGLRQNLSPTRSNGLLSMIKQIKLYALAYQTKYGH
jgi:cysteine desulfuration protein SufE